MDYVKKNINGMCYTSHTYIHRKIPHSDNQVCRPTLPANKATATAVESEIYRKVICIWLLQTTYYR